VTGSDAGAPLQADASGYAALRAAAHVPLDRPKKHSSFERAQITTDVPLTVNCAAVAAAATTRCAHSGCRHTCARFSSNSRNTSGLGSDRRQAGARGRNV
jgi:hypothetical protein